MTCVDVVDAVETIFINYKNYCIYVMPEVNQGWHKLFSYYPLPFHITAILFTRTHVRLSRGLCLIDKNWTIFSLPHVDKTVLIGGNSSIIQ